MAHERRERSSADAAREAAADNAVMTPPDPVVGREPVTIDEETAAARAVLFDEDEGRHFRTRWTDIQAGFVDAPRAAVERADALVTETMKRMADMFAAERANLEAQWDRGKDVTTEDLRVALRRYRAFFDRLLNV